MSQNSRPSRNFLAYLVLASLFAGAAALSPNFAAQAAEKVLKPFCRIEIGDPHLSTFFSETFGVRAVKVNASSICNLTHSNVKLTVRIYKVGLFRNYLVVESSTDPLSPRSSGLRVKNENTFVKCKTIKESRYFGVAFASATIAGENVQAPPARSRKILRLNCGT